MKPEKPVATTKNTNDTKKERVAATSRFRRMKAQWKAQMEPDEVAAVLAGLRQRVAQLGEIAAETVAKIHEKIRYLEHHQDMMKYGTFRAQKLFCGSGVVAAGCRTVIGQRRKQSGRHWNEVFGGPPRTARQRRALPVGTGFARRAGGAAFELGITRSYFAPHPRGFD